MKTINYLLTAMLVYATIPFFSEGQTPYASNYVRTISPRVGSATEPADNSTPVAALNTTSPKVTTVYYDGLGRERSKVSGATGGNGEDIRDLTEYDNYGNVFRQWQPFALQNGAGTMTVDAVKQASLAHYGSDEIPYVTTSYEEAATNRPVAQSHLGKAWNPLHYEKKIQTEYAFNESDLPQYKNVRLFTVGDDGRTLTDAGYYRPYTLRATTITNEDEHRTVEFKTKADRTVLTRRVGENGQFLDTYFVYDIYGCLKYMISPEAESQLPHNAECPTTTLNKLCYFYDYDSRLRLVEKRLPGCEPVYYVYDKLNRPVFTQDGNQRATSTWSVRKYNPRNFKIAVEGTAVLTGATRQSLQQQWGDSLVTAEPQCSPAYEMDLFYPPTPGLSTFEPKTAYFYDNFNHWNGTLPQDASYPYSPSESHQGLPTGTAFLDDGLVMVTATFTDKSGRQIMTAEKDYYSNEHSVTTFTDYSFDGRPLRRKSVFSYLAEGMTIESHTSETEMDYDGGDRVAATRMRIDGGTWRTVEANTYDALGRLSALNYGGAQSGLLPVTFAYDICGNLTETHSPWFDQKVYFTTKPYAGMGGYGYGDNTVSYAGNVNCADESTIGPAANVAGYAKATRNYSYSYDTFDRLTAVEEVNDSRAEVSEYDKNGNITALLRLYDGDAVQDAAITYDGNQLSAVYDVADDYHVGEVPQFVSDDYTGFAYDANGNLTADPTRQITSITYQPDMNLPKRINFANGNQMLWEYSTDGTKRMSQTRTKYITLIPKANGDTIQRVNYYLYTERFYGDFVKIDNSRWRVYHPTGHVDITSQGVQTWMYYVRDRLGSTRAVITEQGVPSQATDYYPSGIPVETYTTGNAYNTTDRLHTGKEFHAFDGLSWHDNAARFHDTLFPRFTTVDPLAEKDPGTSPYAYCGNNPLRFIDPDGKLLKDENGNIIFVSSGYESVMRAWNTKGECSYNIMTDGYVFGDDLKTMIPAQKNSNGKPGWDANCIGNEFADGQVWIQPRYASRILRGDGYEKVNLLDASPGDVVVYFEKEGGIGHAVTIVVSDGTEVNTTVSGLNGTDIKPENSNILDHIGPDAYLRYEIYRKNKSQAEEEKRQYNEDVEKEKNASL